MKQIGIIAGVILGAVIIVAGFKLAKGRNFIEMNPDLNEE